MQITSNPKRRAVSTSVVVGIIIAVVVVAGVAIYFATTTAPSTPSSRTQTTSTAQVTIPSGAGIAPSNWNQSHIISNIYYSPDTIVVVVGVNNTVIWTNRDSVAHTVTSFSLPSGTASFDSGIFDGGGTYSQTFQKPGVYKYFCTIHPWMGGQVIVKSG